MKSVNDYDKIILCSDVHHEVEKFRSIVHENRDNFIIQMGDLMLGLGNNYSDMPKSDNWGFIRGNHDSPIIAKDHPNYLGDYGYIKKHDLFFISGAISPDWRRRTEGKNWWREEQLSHEQFAKIINWYKTVKPRYVISHDAPFSVAKKFGYGNTSLTQNVFEILTYIHKPEIHYHGHYHLKRRNKFNGIRFKCLPFLGICELGK